MGLTHEELRALEALGHPQAAAQPLQDGVVGEILGLLRIAGKGLLEHLGAGEQQEGGEDVEHPGEVGDQGRADADHDRPQHDHTENAPEQHPVLQLPRNGEIGQDQGDDEDVVERQGQLKQIAGVVLHRLLGAEIVPNPGPEREAQGDIGRSGLHRLAGADDVVLAVENPQVEGQHRQDDAEEQQPQPGRLTEERRLKK